jgi:peroxiredoxin
LREHEDKFRHQKIQVRIVTFDNDSRAHAYANKFQSDWPLLIDADRNLYRAYGFEKASWWDLYNPVSIVKYLWLMATGTMPGKPGDDWHQLGGNVLIDPEGTVRLIHASAGPHDRPTAAEILKRAR